MSESEKRSGRGVPLPRVVERLASCSPQEFHRRCPRPVLVEVPADAVLPNEPKLGPLLQREARDEVVKLRMRCLIRGVEPPHPAVHPIPASPAYAGRHPRCNVFMDHEGLAPRHIRLVQGPHRWEVSDLESKTGTTLEGRRLPTGVPTPLWGGEMLALGRLRLLVLFPRHLHSLVGAISRSRARAQHRERAERPLPAPGVRWDALQALVKKIGLKAFLAAHPHPFLLEAEPQRSGIGKDLPLLRPGDRILHGLAQARAGAGLLVGRGADCDVSIDLKSVSTRHAELRTLSDGRWGIMDLESSNGTTLDERRLPPGVLSPLRAGQTLGFSVYRARFLDTSELGELLREPAPTVIQAPGEGEGEVGFPLEGRVDGVAELHDLLVRLERSRRTGTLRLALAPGEAQLVFCVGRIVAARCDTSSGLAALELLCLRSWADYAFDGKLAPGERTLDVSIWSYLCTELGTAQILRAGLEAMHEGGSLRKAS